MLLLWQANHDFASLKSVHFGSMSDSLNLVGNEKEDERKNQLTWIDFNRSRFDEHRFSMLGFNFENAMLVRDYILEEIDVEAMTKNPVRGDIHCRIGYDYNEAVDEIKIKQECNYEISSFDQPHIQAFQISNPYYLHPWPLDDRGETAWHDEININIYEVDENGKVSDEPVTSNVLDVNADQSPLAFSTFPENSSEFNSENSENNSTKKWLGTDLNFHIPPLDDGEYLLTLAFKTSNNIHNRYGMLLSVDPAIKPQIALANDSGRYPNDGIISTDVAEIVLKDYDRDHSKVTFYVSSSSESRSITVPINPETQNGISYEWLLSEGINKISVVTENENGDKSEESSELNVVVDTQRSHLEVIGIKEGRQIGNTLFGDLWGDQFGSIVDISSNGETVAVYSPEASSTPCQIWAADNASNIGECPEKKKNDIQLNLPKGQISVFTKLYSHDVDDFIWVRHYSPIPIGIEAETNVTLMDHKLARLNGELTLFSLTRETQRINTEIDSPETAQSSEQPSQNLHLSVYELTDQGLEFTDSYHDGKPKYEFKEGQQIWKKIHSQDLFLHDESDNVSLNIDEDTRSISVQKNSELYTYQLDDKNNGLKTSQTPLISQLDSNYVPAKTSSSLFYEDDKNTFLIDNYEVGIVGSPFDLSDGESKGSAAIYESTYEYLKLAKKSDRGLSYTDNITNISRPQYNFKLHQHQGVSFNDTEIIIGLSSSSSTRHFSYSSFDPDKAFWFFKEDGSGTFQPANALPDDHYVVNITLIDTAGNKTTYLADDLIIETKEPVISKNDIALVNSFEYNYSQVKNIVKGNIPMQRCKDPLDCSGETVFIMPNKHTLDFFKINDIEASFSTQVEKNGDFSLTYPSLLGTSEFTIYHNSSLLSSSLPFFTGVLQQESGSKISMYAKNNESKSENWQWLDTTYIDENGSWSLIAKEPLQDGRYDIYFNVEDLAGNTSNLFYTQAGKHAKNKNRSDRSSSSINDETGKLQTSGYGSLLANPIFDVVNDSQDVNDALTRYDINTTQQILEQKKVFPAWVKPSKEAGKFTALLFNSLNNVLGPHTIQRSSLFVDRQISNNLTHPLYADGTRLREHNFNRTLKATGDARVFFNLFNGFSGKTKKLVNSLDEELDEAIVANLMSPILFASKAGKVALDAVNLNNKYKLADSIVKFHKKNAGDFGHNRSFVPPIYKYPKNMSADDITLNADIDKIIKNHQIFVASNNENRREALKMLEMFAFQRDYSTEMADKIEKDILKPGGKRKAHLYKPGAGVPYYQMTQHQKAAKIAASKYTNLKFKLDSTPSDGLLKTTERDTAIKLKSIESLSNYSKKLSFANPAVGLFIDSWNLTTSTDTGDLTVNQWLQGLSAANNAANLMAAVGNTKKFNKFVENKFFKGKDELFRKRKGIASNVFGGTSSLLSVSAASLVVAQLISQRDDLQLQLNECESNGGLGSATCRRIADQIDLMDQKINYTVVETSLDIVEGMAAFGVSKIAQATNAVNAAKLAGTTGKLSNTTLALSKAATLSKFLKVAGPIIGVGASFAGFVASDMSKFYEGENASLEEAEEEYNEKVKNDPLQKNRSSELLIKSLRTRLEVGQGHHDTRRGINLAVGLLSTAATMAVAGPGGIIAGIALVGAGLLVDFISTQIEDDVMTEKANELRDEMKTGLDGKSQTVDQFFDNRSDEKQARLLAANDDYVDKILESSNTFVTINTHFLDQTDEQLTQEARAGGEISNTARHYMSQRKKAGEKNWDINRLNLELNDKPNQMILPEVDAKENITGRRFVTFLNPLGAFGREQHSEDLDDTKGKDLFELEIKDLQGWDIVDRSWNELTENRRFTLNDQRVEFPISGKKFNEGKVGDKNYIISKSAFTEPVRPSVNDVFQISDIVTYAYEKKNGPPLEIFLNLYGGLGDDAYFADFAGSNFFGDTGTQYGFEQGYAWRHQQHRMGETKYTKYNKINSNTYEFVEKCLPGDRRCFTGFVDKASYQSPRLNDYLSSGIVVAATPYFKYLNPQGHRFTEEASFSLPTRLLRLRDHLSSYLDADGYKSEIRSLYQGYPNLARSRMIQGDLEIDDQYQYSNYQTLARSTIDHQAYIAALSHFDKDGETLSQEERRLIRNLYTTVEKLGKNDDREPESQRLAGTLMVIKPLRSDTPIFSQQIQDYLQDSKDGNRKQTRQKLALVQTTMTRDHNSIDHLYGVEQLAATDHDDFIDLTGTDMIQHITTGSGNDTLYNGNYLYSGFDGHSEGMNIDMGTGDDVLFMQSRPRVVNMGFGDDTIYLGDHLGGYGLNLFTEKFENPSRIPYETGNGEKMLLNVQTIIDMEPQSDSPSRHIYSPGRDTVILGQVFSKKVIDQYNEYLDAHRAAEQLAEITSGNIDGNMYNKIMEEYFNNDDISMIIQGADLFKVQLYGFDKLRPGGHIDDYTSRMETYPLNFSTPFLNDIQIDDERLSRTFFLEDYRKMFKTVFRADAGIDFSVSAKKPVVIVGSENSDIIKSGSGDDLIYGGSGRDVIHPGRGNDIIVLGGEYATPDIQVNNKLKLSQGHHFLSGNVNDLIKLHIELLDERKPTGWRAHGLNNAHYTLFWEDGSLTIPNFLRLMANRYISAANVDDSSLSDEDLETYSKYGADPSFDWTSLEIEESSQLTYDLLQSAGPLEEAFHCDNPNCFTPTITYGGVADVTRTFHNGIFVNPYAALPHALADSAEDIIADAGLETFYIPKAKRMLPNYKDDYEEHQGFSLFHKDNDWFMRSGDYITEWIASDKRERDGVSHAIWQDPHSQVEGSSDKFSWIHESNLRYNGLRSLFFLGEFDPTSAKYGIVGHRSQHSSLPRDYKKLIKQDTFAEILRDGMHGFDAIEGEISLEEKEFIDYILDYQ